MIGIIGAMEEEISVILSEMNHVGAESYGNLLFYKAKFEDKDVVLVKSGVGMVNAAIATTLLIERFEAETIIFSGVAGGLKENIKVLDLVVGDSFVEYAFDVTKFGYEIGQRAGTNKRDIDSTEELIEIAKNIKSDVNIHFGRVASADIFVDDYEKKNSIKEEFEAAAVDMESASVAHVCEVLNKPFLIVRSISDSLGDNSSIEFSEFINKASKNSKDFVLEVLKRL